MARCKVCPFVGTLNLSTYQLLLSICCRRFEAYCFRMSNFRCRLILASGWCEMIQVDAVDALQAWCIAVFAVRGEAVVLLAFYDLECPVLLKKCACMCISIADSNFWSNYSVLNVFSFILHETLTVMASSSMSVTWRWWKTFFFVLSTYVSTSGIVSFVVVTFFCRIRNLY